MEPIAKHVLNAMTTITLTVQATCASVVLVSCENKTPVALEEKPNKEVQSHPAPHDHSTHQHGNLEVSSFGEEIPIPSVELRVTADSMSGWNVQIQTKNFQFAPENVNADAKPGEGHAHLFVDNYKMARLYGDWYHLKALTAGEHVVRITLNANDHSTWAHQGKAISATTTIFQE